jgi:hypothetical protein
LWPSSATLLPQMGDRWEMDIGHAASDAGGRSLIGHQTGKLKRGY